MIIFTELQYQVLKFLSIGMWKDLAVEKNFFKFTNSPHWKFLNHILDKIIKCDHRNTAFLPMYERSISLQISHEGKMVLRLFTVFLTHPYLRFYLKSFLIVFCSICFYFQEALQHPVVRMLIKTKWQSYGHWFLR